MKLVVAEHGSERATAIWNAAHETTSSRLLYPEVRAALARALRTGRIASAREDETIRAAEALIGDLYELDVTRARTRRAGELAVRLSLRANDAVHLASLESIADEQTLLVDADGELLAAARELGVATAAVP